MRCSLIDLAQTSVRGLSARDKWVAHAVTSRQHAGLGARATALVEWRCHARVAVRAGAAAWPASRATIYW